MKKLIFIITFAVVLIVGCFVGFRDKMIPILLRETGSALSRSSGVKLRFVLKVTKNDQKVTPQRLTALIKARKICRLIRSLKMTITVNFSAARFGISYQGTLSEKGDEISGTFKQGEGTLTPLDFKRVPQRSAKTNAPQDPKKPYPYKEEEVTYKNVKDNVKLAGTLTLPTGEGRFPAVVLITGSGAQDRDGTVVGHRLFLVLADYLTRKGIAVLRVDDRGIGGSERGSPLATTANYVGRRSGRSRISEKPPGDQPETNRFDRT